MRVDTDGPNVSRRERPRLLVVPHLYAENISVREIEFARRFVRHFDVYCLRWNDALHIEDKKAVTRKFKQIHTALLSSLTRHKLLVGNDGITYVLAPVLQPIFLQRVIGEAMASSVCRSFNRHTLEMLTDRLNVSHILLAAGTFGLPRRSGVRGFFDVVDWIPEDRFSPDFVQFKRKELLDVVRQTRAVFAVSQPLCEKLQDDCGIKAVPIPNGADLERLRQVTLQETANLRRKLNLEHKFVIGYIGNHGSYTGVDFLVEVFRQVRQRVENAALLIVGPAEHWRKLLESSSSDGVVWTGPVAPAEVGGYFNALDIGVLAQIKSPGTEFAFQLKIVEYSACRKFVVSTPLRTWELLQWPNVFLTELKVDAWVEAIIRAQQSRWNPTWDRWIDAYDWKALADRMTRVMLDPASSAGNLCES